MIYLTRTTIDLDGTRTTEIAVLEDTARLKAYQAEGWQVVTYEAWRQVCQAACERVYARLRDAAEQRGAQAGAAQGSARAASLCCPECSCDKVTVFVGGRRHCRRCKNNW